MNMAEAVRHLYMGFRHATQLSPFLHSAHDPAAAQQRVLMHILRCNADTRFGKRHHFENIKNTEQFRSSVDVQNYESLQSDIEFQEREGSVLTASPIRMFTRTSGTTGSSKLLPMTQDAIRRMRDEQALLNLWLYRQCPEAFGGKALGIVSPAVEGTTDYGTPVGSASGYIYRSMPRMLRKRYILPYETFEIADYELKYRAIAQLALQELNITYLGTANPSTLVHLLDIINKDIDVLLAGLEHGTMMDIGKLPPAQANAMRRQLKACPQRAAQLREVAKKRHLQYRDIWPDIALVMTWTGGSCGMALKAVKQSLPEGTTIVDPGYLSSECRGTLAYQGRQGGLPLLTSQYYEFVERRLWEIGGRDFLGLDELKEGIEYYLLITTDTGLYRYFMNDIVVVDGFLHKTPLLRFLRKGSGVVNITGEKVSESHLLSVVRRMEEQFCFALHYFICLADEQRLVYQLFIETAEDQWPSVSEMGLAADQLLRKTNIEYDQKRASGRLHAMELFRLKRGTADSVKRFYVSRGQRENQFKPPILMLASECPYPIREELAW